MRWILLVTVGCGLCFTVSGAPQDISDTEVDQSIGKEDPSTPEMPAESPADGTSISEPAGEESTLTYKTESDPPTLPQGVTPDAIIVEQEIATKKEESDVTIEQTASQKPVELVTETTITKKPTVVPTSLSSKKPTTVIIPTQLPTKKPVRATTAKPLESPVTIPTVAPSTTANPTRRYPCRCGGGMCSCCSGLILENFNVPFRSRACANVTYEPEDFAFNFKLLYNNRLLYNTRMSAKNPRPACIPINRYFGIKMCVKLSNIYMSGRNIHACLDMEGYWDDESAFQYSFNCFRIGSNGIAVVHPEDGGGLPPPPDEEEQTDEDYDDSARGWTSEVEVV